MLRPSDWHPASDPRYSLLSKFFSLGQVIETVRGGGVFQPAIDDAIKKLGQGEWVSFAGLGWSRSS